MPVTLFEREQAFEAKFALDEAFRFRVGARRDKLLAHWAAARVKLSEQAESDLVRAVLAIADGPGHDRAVCDHLTQFFARRGVGRQEAQITAMLTQCTALARQQLIDAPLDPEQPS